MALKIRLRHQGRKNRPFYRLVLTESRAPRDGRYKETLGWYNPVEKDAEKNLSIQADRVQHWLELGAEPSEKAEALIKRSAPEVIATLRAKRAKRQAQVCEKKRLGRKKKEATAKA